MCYQGEGVWLDQEVVVQDGSGFQEVAEQDCWNFFFVISVVEN